MFALLAIEKWSSLALMLVAVTIFESALAALSVRQVLTLPVLQELGI